jgi:polar amino acid transport system substrate-binding protein
MKALMEVGKKLVKLTILLILVTLHSFRANADETINICSELWPPYYAIRGPYGQPRGIMVDIADEIASRLDLPMQYHIVTHSRCVEGAKKGRFDGSVSATSYGSHGLIIGDHSGLYWILSAYVRAGDPLNKYKSLDDFNGLRWLRVDLYEYPPNIRDFKKWSIINFRDQSDIEDDDNRGFRILQRNRADVYLEDYFWAQNALEKELHSVKVLYPPVAIIAQYTGFSPTKGNLAKKWDQELGIILSDGTVDKIYKKWTGKTLKEFFKMFGADITEVK